MKKKIKIVIPSLLLGATVILLIYRFRLGLCLLFAILAFEFIRYILLRKAPLAINTPDGSNQPYHPSALFFNNSWCGHRYYMAYTPFPVGAEPYRDRWEYPCMAASEDGINWRDANGNKPLDDLTEQQILERAYFSDTHLVYNSLEDRLELYYRLSEGDKVKLLRKTSKDGVVWSKREDVFAPVDYPVISPAIEYENGVYSMWYVKEVDHIMSIHYANSDDGLTWKYGGGCKLIGATVNPWHLDCKKYSDKFYLLTYDFSHTLMLWQSNDGVNFEYLKTILKANGFPGSFYRLTLYRSCMLNDENGYKVYFSAGNEREVKIGLMQGDNLQSLRVVSGTGSYNWRSFFLDLLESYTLLYRWVWWKNGYRKNKEQTKTAFR